MCFELLPSGSYPIAVKYIISKYAVKNTDSLTPKYVIESLIENGVT
jgi:hypothetical protein